MAFRLKPQESVAHGLRRLAKREVISARDELSQTRRPRDEAVHEARKSLKKVRAVMKLIEDDDGRGLAGCRKRLSRISRALSSLRDADAMVTTLTRLKQRDRDLFNELGFARIHRRLSQHKQSLERAALDDRTWSKINRDLRTLRDDVAQWRPRHRQFGALENGIEAAYRRGRTALARARNRQRADDFHRWRKRIKALWYQLRLIDWCGPDVRKDIRVLEDAETWLGEDHDLVLLCAQLSKDGSLRDLKPLQRRISLHQRRLRRKTIAAAAAMYGPTPDEYIRGLRRAWNARSRPKSGDAAHGPRRAAA